MLTRFGHKGSSGSGCASLGSSEEQDHPYLPLIRHLNVHRAVLGVGDLVAVVSRFGLGSLVSCVATDLTEINVPIPDRSIEVLSKPYYFQYYKWYAGLALFSELGTARLEGITP